MNFPNLCTSISGVEICFTLAILIFLGAGFLHFISKWLHRKDDLQDAFERAQKKKEDIADF